MQNFFAKAVAVAMLVGGFGFTGDLGWIADKGQRVLGAADVPSYFEVVPTLAPPTTPSHNTQHLASDSDPVMASPQSAQPPSAPPKVASEPESRREPDGLEPVGSRFKPPVGGPDEVAWAALDTGSRVVMWLAGPPYRCLVVDFVDPVSGEALLYEVATVDAASRPLTTAGPPRRVIIGRDEAGRPHGIGIVRGGLIHVAQTGIAPHAAGQWLGPVTAIGLGP